MPESLPELFSRTVAEHGDRTALIHDDTTTTYRDLDTATTGLASRLLTEGVRPGDHVAVAAPRGIDVPVAVLAALKTGAAYVPVDTTLPDARIAHVLDDSGARTIVTTKELAHRFTGVTPILVDERGPHRPLSTVGADDTAYIIYTSGSTGRPKGCVVTHGNVLALLDAALPMFDVTETDRWAQFHSHAFDVSVWELWACLATGAAAVLIPDDTARSGDRLLAHLAATRVSVLCQVPSAFRALALTFARHPVDLALRHVILAGESVELDVVAGFLDRFERPPACSNLYGPTETTVYVSGHRLTPADLASPVRTPIGRPFPTVGFEILDDDGAPVADGAEGELWIAGPTVAAGYLHRPELTAERFGTTCDGRRRYRSGDLARRLPDGSFEFRGRRDHQIKFRGYRIELGDIENALRTSPDVEAAAVALTETAAGARLITAWIQPTGAKQDPDLPARLRTHLSRRLPEYMVPGRYRTVTALPVGLAGKLDRAALIYPVT
ncbi:amino acid adenylation domain-containing protein [Phytomonospora endophytica]|uniref:Amino acid adenylation domain-containing protein n=1 Tax=Phytomonospora endophytica TaxID=714109 RepID=A0A841FRZ8_9ACTN|nr:amino acid adenylation domain-containing protein [Phytomonospora endophytica]MBB6038826.1 amino acid adenylation domain-containing protein [Phytomonospora endophytica]GIG68378.1 hypothetical protein Pen01_46730 [Phytomonospora endophytica]